MAKNKERKASSSFGYSDANSDYNFQMKKRRYWWLWLLLLLLPLLLLIPLKKDITVYTQLDGQAEPYVDVSMNYTARYLLWDKKFNVKMPYDTIQQTDSTGCTVFKGVGYSVYSFIFHFKTPIVFTAGGGDCYDSKRKECRFHTTKKVYFEMVPKLSDVRLKVVDKELRFELPGATVECEYQGKKSLQKTVDTTDAAGCVVLKDARVCSEFNSIKVSAEGYADTLLSNLQVIELLKDAGGYVIPLRPLKERFIFYVKNVYTKEPIPGALAEVTLTLNGQVGSGGTSKTNVDGLGQGFFDNARVLATIGIKASKQGYYDSTYVSPKGKPNPITVKDFIKLDSIDRVVWLRPKPQTVQFRNVDTLSGKPISGVRNEIVVESIDGTTHKPVVSISNRNGYFDVTALPGDKITIKSTLDPYYYPKTTVIGKFDKAQIIYMRPVLVDLTFRTMEMLGNSITGVLPDCGLVITVDGKKVNPTNSGSGTFTVPQLRLTSKISIVASKPGYDTNDTKVRDKSVELLNKAAQDERDIPLVKQIKLTFRTMEAQSGTIVGLLPNCTLVVTVDGKKVLPQNSGNGEFVVENLKYNSIISIVASKPGYVENRDKIANRFVSDLMNAPQNDRDIPLEVAQQALRPCDQMTQSGSNSPESFVFDMGQKGGSFVLEYDTGNEYPDRIIIHDGDNKNGNVIFDYSGTTHGTLQKTILFTQTSIFIEVIPSKNSDTFWKITAHCPQ